MKILIFNNFNAFAIDANSFVNSFINHHKNYVNKFDVERNHWKKNISSFIKLRKNMVSYESILNIRVEEFEGINRIIRLFIVEIEKMIPWDDNNSLFSSSTKNTVSRSKMIN